MLGIASVSIFCAEVNGDSALDLIAVNEAGFDVSVLANDGCGVFHNRVDYGVGNRPKAVFCADLDGDGDLDLATANYTGDNVTVLMNITQLPGNQPPNPFSLLSPPSKAFTPRNVRFDWETATDPNIFDQLRYDLYVSTSYQFPDDSTTVDSDLVVSEHRDFLDYGTHFWKVRAKDNWGAERWCSQIGYFMVTGVHYSSGDFNGDGEIDPGDVVYAVSYLFRNGADPESPTAGDCNCDGSVGPEDVVFLINYLFRDGPPPRC